MLEQDDQFSTQGTILRLRLAAKAVIEGVGDIADVKSGHTNILVEVVAECNTAVLGRALS